MKTSDKERLLNDLINDESYLAFRAGLRESLARDLLCERASSRRYKLLLVAACVPMAIGLWLYPAMQTGRVRDSASKTSIVRTIPLQAERIITTAGASDKSLSISPRVLVISTSATQIEIVHSASKPEESLTDEQLLAMFKGQPAALVFIAPNERRLVLPDEEARP